MASDSNPTSVPILRATLDNDAFRQVLMTGSKGQVVLMSIPPGQEIGAEVHEEHDQVLVFVAGTGEAILDGSRMPVQANDLVFVHAGVEHNFINTGDRALKLFTFYAPPEHEHGVRHDSKAEADAAEAH